MLLSLADITRRRAVVFRRHMQVFAAWSALNIVMPLPVFLTYSPGFWYYFAMMCMTWGAINGILAAVLWFRHRERLLVRRKRSWIQGHIEQVLALNLALDVGYVFIGIGMYSEGSETIAGLWRGFGAACMVQGFFLALQDGFVLRAYRKFSVKKVMF